METPKKCVYGLGDAPRQWYKRLSEVLQGLGMIRSKLDPGILLWFYKSNLEGIIAVQLDDLMYGGPDLFLKSVIKNLYECSKLGMRKMNSSSQVSIFGGKMIGFICLRHILHISSNR